jgi:hypothetical protein
LGKFNLGGLDGELGEVGLALAGARRTDESLITLNNIKYYIIFNMKVFIKW